MLRSQPERGHESFPVLRLADALRGTCLGRLDKYRIVQFLLHPAHHLVHIRKFAAAHTHELRLTDADGVHDDLRVELIHGAG